MTRRVSRHFTAFVTTIVLGGAPWIVPVSSYAATTGGQLGGFEIDGDFAYPHSPAISGATRDWSTLPAPVVRADDQFNSGSDDSFGGGSKESDPDGWTFVGHEPPDKADLVRVYGAADVTNDHAYLFLGFERLASSGQGDVHVDFELNRETTTVVNGQGTAVPARSAGDLLVTFDYDGGDSSPQVVLYRWTGTALSGSWASQAMPAGSTMAAVNAVAITRPAAAPFGGGTVDAGNFGEAAVDLRAVYGSSFPGCPGIAGAYAKTRSSGESTDSQLKDLVAPVRLDVSQCPDVHVAKTASAQTVEAGSPLSYIVTATNDGVAPAGSVVITDAVPASLTIVSATYDVDPGTPGGTGACTVGSANAVSCAVGSLAASDGNTTGPEPDTAVVTITTTTASSSCGVLHNVAEVASPDERASDRSDNQSADAPVTVRCPDVRVEKSTQTPSVSAGDPISYDIAVSNIGAAAATGVVVSDALPGAFTWTLNPPVTGCAIAAGTLTCSFATLAPGASISLHLVASTGAQTCGDFDNTVWVSASNEPESLRSNNAAGPVRIHVGCALIDIAKSADASPVSAGDPIGFTITVHNGGVGNAYGTTLTDALPSGFAWSMNGGTAAAACLIDTGVLTCSIGTMAPGATATVHIGATTPAASCGSVNNTARVTTSNDGSDEAAASIRIDCPSLSVEKAPDASPVSAGETAGFAMVVHNGGPGTAYAVTLSDSLPPGPSWSVTAASGSCGISAGVLSCSFGDLAAGASSSVHVSATTRPADCGSLSNTVTASARNAPPVSATGTVDVLCPAMRIIKTADRPSVVAGDPIGFGISVTNDGPGSALGVMITDALPSGGGIAWAIDGGTAAASCSIAGGVLSCSAGTMGAHATQSVHVSSPTGKACATYENTATAEATNHTSVSATAQTGVRCASLELTKTADAGGVTAGDDIGFTIAVSNLGDGEARGVHVEDSLPVAPGLAWSTDGGSMAASCAISGGVLTCDLDTLATGAQEVVHITSGTTGVSCGIVENVATAASSNDGEGRASATVTIDCPVGISLVKSGPALAHVGDTVTYTLDVQTTSITPLVEVGVVDPVCDAAPVLLGGDGGIAGLLETGETWSYTCSHVVTAADPDPLPNTATASGVGNARIVEATASHVVDLIHPAISLDKTVDPVSGSPGATVVYTYVVTNTGDVTLAPVVVTDDKLGTIGTLPSLAAGATATLTKAVVLGNTATSVTNVGMATGVDPLQVTVTDTDTAQVSVVLGTKLVRTGAGPFGWALGIMLVLGGAALVIGSRKETRAPHD